MKILGHATYIGSSGYNSHCQNFFKALSKTHEVKIRNFTVGKNWKGLQASDPHDGDANESDKDLIVQQSLWDGGVLKDFDIYAGLRDYAHDANIVLAEVNHHYFYHNYSGPKIAYTVWENTIYPEGFFNKLKEYDQVWVPSKWQADITVKQGIEANKIKIIPEGVDSSLFYPEDLKYEDDKFRFLIFGRWDDRKSIKELIEAFKNIFWQSEKVELVISVDNPYSIDGMNSTEERLKFYNIDSSNIKILHFPSKEDYAKYLKRGHVFLSCARSEGWNLPLIEAMACGIPSLYSNCSGQLEFAQGKGIPVDVRGERPANLSENSYSKNQSIGNWYEPDFKDLESKILEVYNNYNFYKAAALKDSVLIRDEFTWGNAAKKAGQAIKELFKNKRFSINYLGQSENGLSIYYNSNTDHDVKINAKIVDEYTGFVFYDHSFFINNKYKFHTNHAYSLPNQIFRIYDFETKELLLEKKTNVNDVTDVKKLKAENKNLIEQIPEDFKTHSTLGFSFFEIYNRQTYSFKNCKIEKGDLVFDIGSCMGLFSRYAFQNGASEVHAFEPNKELEGVFVSLNKDFNYFYSNKAVHSKPVSFQKSEDLLNSEVIEGGSFGSNINLNDYIKEKNITKIDYLKIDIEGSEYDLFETLDENFLCNNVKKMAIEYHSNSDNRIAKILNKLKKLGFTYQFEFQNGASQELGMLYAWKISGFDFEAFFGKYRDLLTKSGYSRVKFYEYVIPKLVAKNKPIYVLETGAMWLPLEDNSGAFTLVMADLIKNVTGGKIYSVDISPINIEKSKKNTEGFHEAIEFVVSDSVTYIKNLSDEFAASLDLVYLDSYDFSFPDPHPSAQHHLDELEAVYNRLNDDCGVGIDDNFLPNCWVEWNTYDGNGSTINKERFDIVDNPKGKAEYCHPKLIGKGWRRFTEFDDFPNNSLFYYERQKLTSDKVQEILNNFYNKNKIQKPKTKNFLNYTNISNSAKGLGDAVILNNLCESKFIHAEFANFDELQKFNDKYKKQNSNEFFDINSSGYNNYDWNGGHCIQRLEKAFLGKSNLIPKPYINKEHNPIKNRLMLHLKGKTDHLEDSLQKLIAKFLIDCKYEVLFWDDSSLSNSIELISSCEYFVGINSGPMHIAAGLGVKSVILLNRKDSCNIYLPKIEEADIPDSEWVYPQNIHLSILNDNELIERFSLENLKRALNGNLYPYFSHDYIIKEDIFKWSFEKETNKLNFSFNRDYENARIVLKEKNKNLKCFDWTVGSISKDMLYHIIPTANLNLLDVDFEGFIFSIYLNSNLEFENQILIRKLHSIPQTKYFSDKETDLSSFDSFYIQYSDFYNNKFLKSCLADKKVIIDVGASCGSFVDICLQNGGHKVVALEPSKSFRILNKTFENNKNVICLNKALSTDCSSRLFHSTDHTTLSGFEIESQKKFDSANLIKNTYLTQVNCVDLETLKKDLNLKTIDLLKIDIEGFEYELIESFSLSAVNSISNILIEYHHNENGKINSIINKLKNFNYEVSLMDMNYQMNSSLQNLQGVIYAKKNAEETALNVINESGSLGDAIAWIPIVNEFAIQKNTKVNLYGPFKNLFEKEYPLINFLDYSEKPQEITEKIYSLGCFDDFDYKSYSLQGIACKLLGLEEKEIKTKITINKQKSTVSNKKYVCIATQSTAQCKYWNRKDGWRKVVDYLKALGYDVVCIDKDYSYGSEGLMNIIPENAINKTGDLPLENRINDLYNCEFFIGISSGLSWLAWACDKPVVLISGFTDPKLEFFTPYRVHNKNVCNSCWSDANCVFDRGNWVWCPRAKDFECSKEITFEMVKEKIDLLILDKNIK